MSERQLARGQRWPSRPLPLPSCVYGNNARIQIAVLAQSGLRARVAVQGVAEVNRGRVEGQALGGPNEDSAAPLGQIRSPALAEFVKPGFSGLALGVSQAGEGSGRRAGRFAGVQGRDVLRVETGRGRRARGAGGHGRMIARAGAGWQNKSAEGIDKAGEVG